MIKNKNELLNKIDGNKHIMLNDFNGKDKFLWWDYHYSSVYIAHFLFWIVLAKHDFHKNPITIKKTKFEDTGLVVNSNSDFYLSSFNGRKKYLSEKGPVISSLWIKK